MDIKTEKKSKLCRLCFLYCDNNFVVLTNETNKMLELLFLKSDPNTGEEQITCTTCSINIEVYFQFKSSCLNSENYIKSVINSEGNSKVNLSQILANTIDTKHTVNLSEDHAVCRLCLKLVQNGYWTPLNEEINVETLKMLKQWLPELDLNISENPVMCVSCQESLEDYFNFINKYQDVGNHCGFKGKCELDQNESKLNSNFILQNYFIHEDRGTEFECQDGGNINEIIFDNKILMDIKTQEISTEQAEIGVTSENATFSRNDEVSTLINENATIPKSTTLSYKCELCTYSTNNKWKFTRHMVVHQDASSAVMYSCHVCPFTSKHEASLRSHKKIHRDDVTIYQCETCKYKTKYKSCFKRHLLIHQSEVTLYQCEICKYKTKYKSCLNKHLLIHKYTYCCNTCSYRSSTQKDMDIHNLVHNEAIPMPKQAVYSCETCPYQTKHQPSFNRHRITHLDASDMYECKVCGLKTHKYNFDKHMLTHEGLKYRCKDCDFETNSNKEFEKHSLLHLPGAKTNLFHCADCKFMTKYKRNLRKHMDIHQKESSMKLYRCDICYFETKHKHYIKLHALTHRDPSERKMYACDMCDYKALRNLNVLRHKSQKHGVDENK